MANQGKQRSVPGRNQPEREEGRARCPRCGGMLYVERLPDDAPRQKFLEWTCLICGWTHYPGRKEESARNEKKPQEAESRWKS